MKVTVSAKVCFLLLVIVSIGLLTGCAHVLVGPTDPDSSLVIGRIVIKNKYRGQRGLLPLGNVKQGIEIDVQITDMGQPFKVTTERQGYFFIANMPPKFHYVRRVKFEGREPDGAYEWFSMPMQKLYFKSVPGKVVYIGTLIIELNKESYRKTREIWENEKAKAYFLQKYGDSPWAAREFILKVAK